jgi:hypothetical protein
MTALAILIEFALNLPNTSIGLRFITLITILVVERNKWASAVGNDFLRIARKQLQKHTLCAKD